MDTFKNNEVHAVETIFKGQNKKSIQFYFKSIIINIDFANKD